MQPKPYRWVGVGQMREMGYMILIHIFNTIKTTNIIWINQCLSLVPNMGVVACACLMDGPLDYSRKPNPLGHS